MKILIDTNVIIDILQKREPFFGESYHALRKAIENGMSATEAFATFGIL